jgi:hypothetical protein
MTAIPADGDLPSPNAANPAIQSRTRWERGWGEGFLPTKAKRLLHWSRRFAFPNPRGFARFTKFAFYLLPQTPARLPLHALDDALAQAGHFLLS